MNHVIEGPMLLLCFIYFAPYERYIITFDEIAIPFVDYIYFLLVCKFMYLFLGPVSVNGSLSWHM